ncbi:MAG: hypothetical protein D6800_03750, partial [Candidatus Zixiibacteriota bacterium]
LIGLDLMHTPDNGTQYYAYSSGDLKLYSVNVKGYAEQRNGTKYGIYLNGGTLFMSRSTVSGIYAINGGVYGVYGSGAKVEIERSTFRDNGDELGSNVYQIFHDVSGTDEEKIQQGLILDRVTIEPARTFNGVVYGIWAYARRVTITNSIITGIDYPGDGGGYGAYLQDDMSCNTCGGLVDIRDSSFTGAGSNRGTSGSATGLYLRYWQNVQLEGNTFVAGLSGSGTSYGARSVYSRYVTAMGNTFSAGQQIASSGRGLDVYDTDGRLDLYNNAFDTGSLNNTGYGLYVNTGDALVEITHNTVSLGTWADINNDTSWTAYGIAVRNMSTMSPGVTIANNSIRGFDAWTGAGLAYSADYYGIYLSNNGTTAETRSNSIVFGVSRNTYGIYSNNNTTRPGQVVENVIRTGGGSRVYGIYSNSDDDLTVSGNRITQGGPENELYGITVLWGSGQSVLGNTIVIEGGDGVYAYGLLESYADTTTLFRGNTVQIGDNYSASGIRLWCGYARYETNNISLGQTRGSSAYGVYNQCGDATFRGNNIEIGGSNGGGNIFGFYIVNDGLTLIDNQISAGGVQNSSSASYGLYVASADDDLWIEGNTINGGETENGDSYGVFYYSDASGVNIVFVNNRIDGGQSRSKRTYGFYMGRAFDSNLVMINNFIHGGRAGYDGYSGRTWGMYFDEEEIDVYLGANSIYGGDADYGSSNEGAIGLYFRGSDYGFVVTNNIIHAGSNLDGSPIAVVDDSQGVGTMGSTDFYNNLLFGAGTFHMYRDAGSATFIDSIATINACGWDACGNASGNIEGDP